jgi:hypothetical protein
LQIAKKLLVISIAILGIMTYVYLANFLIIDWRSLNQEFREFIPIAGLAGIALFLIAIRNVEGVNKHLLTSMEVLITVSIPTIAGLRFMMNTDYGQSMFSGGIAIFSVLWVIYFTKKGKSEKEIQDILKARLQIIGMFVVLIAFSVITFVSVENFQNLLKYDS